MKLSSGRYGLACAGAQLQATESKRLDLQKDVMKVQHPFTTHHQML